MNVGKRFFVIVDPATPVERNERGELNTNGVIGVVSEINAYICAYPSLAEGEPRPEDMQVGQRSCSAKYNLSGSVGFYDIVRVA
jgi:hypothetical protein